jgi:4-hydroxyphenylacetate 3-monooxygenase
MTTLESTAPETNPDTSPQITVNPVPDAARKAAQTFATKPMTGHEYIESLKDDREIYLQGERVKDVTTHPAFRNPIRMTARLYDSMHAGPLTPPFPVSVGHVTVSTGLRGTCTPWTSWSTSPDTDRGDAKPR